MFAAIRRTSSRKHALGATVKILSYFPELPTFIAHWISNSPSARAHRGLSRSPNRLHSPVGAFFQRRANGKDE
jgi:hypothetical protein